MSEKLKEKAKTMVYELLVQYDLPDGDWDDIIEINIDNDGYVSLRLLGDGWTTKLSNGVNWDGVREHAEQFIQEYKV